MGNSKGIVTMLRIETIRSKINLKEIDIMSKWKEIKDFKNVINDMYLISDDGEVMNKHTKKILHKKIANKKHHPYYAVSLLHNDGRVEWVLVHQLVATYFVKVPDNLIGVSDLVPDHLDNNGLNNKYTNLEWKTRGENVADAHRKGYINNSGENHSGIFITETEAHKICQLLVDGKTYDEILNICNYPNTKKYRCLLVRIKNGLSWKYVSSQYDIKKLSKMYTKKQRDTINKISIIRKLLSEGKTTSEIFDIVYADEEVNREVKMSLIRNIKKGIIFNEIKS